MYPKNEVFGGFESEYVKILCSNPQKGTIPCVNTRQLERFCIQTKKKRKR